MIDYVFIERLLQTMTKEKTFCVDVMHLNEELGKSFPDMNVDDFNNKFYESLFLLKDCGIVEEMAGNINIGVGTIRLKADGYEFYDNLCKEWFMAYIEKLPLSAAVMYSKAETVKNFGIS